MKRLPKILLVASLCITAAVIVSCAALGGGGVSPAQQAALQQKVDETAHQLSIEQARTQAALNAATAANDPVRIAAAQRAQALEAQLQTMITSGQTQVTVSRGPDNVIAVTGVATGAAAVIPMIAPYVAILGIAAGVIQTVRKSFGDTKAGNTISNLGTLVGQVSQANSDAEVVAIVQGAKPESAQAVLDTGLTVASPAVHSAVIVAANKT